MSVLILIDHSEGQIKKSSFEALSYGAAVAQQLNVSAQALLLGTVTNNLSDLGKYGVSKVFQVADEILNAFDAQVYAQVIAESAQLLNATVIVVAQNQTGKAIAGRISVLLKAGLVTGAIALPDTSNGFVVKKSVFSNKAFANVAIHSAVKIIALNPNSFSVALTEGTATVELLSIKPKEAKVKIVSVNKISGEVPLTEAEIVVSGGRGLKGPENWGIVEDLAKVLHAATACSRPVADTHWRPHHEHVGQTGFQIAPNLYIAIGISGAIQHLAGVNRSKTIVVINKDPEAPFFKAADYGIVGDAFEVVPQLTAEIKKLKG